MGGVADNPRAKWSIWMIPWDRMPKNIKIRLEEENNRMSDGHLMLGEVLNKEKVKNDKINSFKRQKEEQEEMVAK